MTMSAASAARVIEPAGHQRLAAEFGRSGSRPFGGARSDDHLEPGQGQSPCQAASLLAGPAEHADNQAAHVRIRRHGPDPARRQPDISGGLLPIERLPLRPGAACGQHRAMDADQVAALQALIAPTGWLDRTAGFARALRRQARTPNGLLIVGTRTAEPWHMTAHLASESEYAGIPELAPTLIRWTPPPGAPAHLAVGLDRWRGRTAARPCWSSARKLRRPSCSSGCTTCGGPAPSCSRSTRAIPNSTSWRTSSCQSAPALRRCHSRALSTWSARPR